MNYNEYESIVLLMGWFFSLFFIFGLGAVAIEYFEIWKQRKYHKKVQDKVLKIEKIGR